MTRITRRTVTQTMPANSARESLSTSNNSSPAAPITQPTPAASNWCFNERLRIITHEPRTCNTCNSWALHYVEHVLNDVPSLRDAERARDAAFTGTLREERDLLLAENASLVEQLNALKSNSGTQDTQGHHASLAPQAQITEPTELQEERPCKMPRHSPSPGPCTPVQGHAALPASEGTPHSHPTMPPLLDRIQDLDEVTLALRTHSTPHIPSLLPVIYYHQDNSLHPAYDIYSTFLSQMRMNLTTAPTSTTCSPGDLSLMAPQNTRLP